MLAMRPAVLCVPQFGSEKPLFQQQVTVSRHSRNLEGKTRPDRQHPSLKRVLKQKLIYSLALRLRRNVCHKKAWRCQSMCWQIQKRIPRWETPTWLILCPPILTLSTRLCQNRPMRLYKNYLVPIHPPSILKLLSHAGSGVGTAARPQSHYS